MLKYVQNYLFVNAIKRNSHRRCSIKKLFLKTFYSSKRVFTVNFEQDCNCIKKRTL